MQHDSLPPRKSEGPFFREIDVIRVLLAFALLAASTAKAQDALRGKRLYLDAARVVGSGVSCVDCHGGLPGGVFGIGRAANNPAIVENAVNSVAAMTPFRGRLAAADYADLAAYIGQPAVPSAVVRITTSLPGGAAGADDRIEFGDIAAGATSGVATLRITNAGAVAFAVTAAPVLAGANAGEFSIEATDCATAITLAATQSCRVDLRFRPAGVAGARTARVGVSHDWVGGAAAVALLGNVPSTAQPPGTSPSSPGSGGGGGLPIVWLMLLLLACPRRRVHRLRNPR